MNERILVSLTPYENVLMIDKMREVVEDDKRELGGFIYTSYNLHIKIETLYDQIRFNPFLRLNA